jgi:hypothetical protein
MFRRQQHGVEIVSPVLLSVVEIRPETHVPLRQANTRYLPSGCFSYSAGTLRFSIEDVNRSAIFRVFVSIEGSEQGAVSFDVQGDSDTCNVRRAICDDRVLKFRAVPSPSRDTDA